MKHKTIFHGLILTALATISLSAFAAPASFNCQDEFNNLSEQDKSDVKDYLKGSGCELILN